MPFTIACPSCQRTLRVPESLLGQSVKCPTCEHTFSAPDSVEEEAPRRSASPAEERPSRRSAAPPPEDDYEEERPSKRRARSDDDDDDAPRRRRGRGVEKPGKVQAIGIMVLIGGIIATLASIATLGYLGFVGLVGSIGTLGLSLGCCLWPGPYYGLVMGIMAIVRGSRLLGEKAYRETPPSGIGIMMIINVINCDGINLVMGILVLVFLGDQEVKDYFRG